MRLPSGLECIDGYTFKNCTKLNSINFPDSLKTIGNNAFTNSTLTGQLSLPDGLIEIYYDAFKNCKNLYGALIIPDRVKEIGSSAFDGCSNISGSLILGKSVRMIGQDAFRNIGDINAVVVKAATPPKGYRFPDELYKNAVLYVPLGTYAEYSTAEIWRDFANIEELEYQSPEKLEVTIGKLTLSSDSDNKNNFIVVPEGSSIPIKSVVTPSNPINDNVYWNSLDTLICDVRDGYLKMKNSNNTYLIAKTCNNLSVTFEVKGGTPISTIELPDTVEVELGKNKTVRYNMLPAGYHFGDMEWEIKDSSVADINTKYGTVTGKVLGCTILTVTAGDGWGATDTCVVKVIPPHVTEITLNKSKVTYRVDQSHEPLQLTANVIPYNAIQDVIWTSNSEQIATVDTNGLVTFHGYGDVIIRATAAENEKIYAECKITLEHSATVALNGKGYSVYFEIFKDDEDSQFTFNYSPSSLPMTDISFESSDKNVFTVTSDGKATWVGNGYATLYFSYNLYDKTYEKNYMVKCSPARFIQTLTFKQPFIEVPHKDQFNLDLTDLDLDPTDAIFSDIEWTVLDESIVDIVQESSDNSAKFLARGVGETDIIAKAKKGTAQAVCHVKVLPIQISSITISIDEQSLSIGSRIKVSANITPYDTDDILLWSSTDESVATVESDHESTDAYINAVGIGETDIMVKALLGDVMAKCHIIVLPIPVQNVYFNRSFIYGSVGDEFQLDVTIYPENATNKTLEWSSENPAIVSVDDSGKILLKKSGQCQILARSIDNPDQYDHCSIYVSEASNIDDVFDEKNPFVRIYSLDGFLVYKGTYFDANLNPGFYILHYKDKSIKLRINSKTH